jgi:hypothetical protein
MVGFTSNSAEGSAARSSTTATCFWFECWRCVDGRVSGVGGGTVDWLFGWGGFAEARDRVSVSLSLSVYLSVPTFAHTYTHAYICIHAAVCLSPNLYTHTYLGSPLEGVVELARLAEA